MLGTLLHEWPAQLPGAIRNLLTHAPESFDDPRLGEVAVAIRKVNMAGHGVNVVTVGRELGGELEAGDFVRALLPDAVP